MALSVPGIITPSGTSLTTVDNLFITKKSWYLSVPGIITPSGTLLTH